MAHNKAITDNVAQVKNVLDRDTIQFVSGTNFWKEFDVHS